MSTLLIAGGQLVDEHAIRRADVLVRDGRVAEVLQPGQHPVADDVLDAEGLHDQVLGEPAVGLEPGSDADLVLLRPRASSTPVWQDSRSRVEPGFGQLVRV